MKTVTIEQVENGYIVTDDDDEIRIATCVHSYNYEQTSLVGVLKEIFEPKPASPEIVQLLKEMEAA